jgi:hypothetical protein
VLADAERGDRVLCQITSKPYGDSGSVILDDGLRVRLVARDELRTTGQLFTASSDLITAQVGVLTRESLTRIVDAVVALLRAGAPATSAPDRG